MKFNRSVYQALMMISQFGINMLVPVFICSFAGMWLDKKLGTDFLIIIFFILGAVSGGYNVFRFARRIYQGDVGQSAYLHRGRKSRSKADERKDHKDQQDTL